MPSVHAYGQFCLPVWNTHNDSMDLFSCKAPRCVLLKIKEYICVWLWKHHLTGNNTWLTSPASSGGTKWACLVVLSEWQEPRNCSPVASHCHLNTIYDVTVFSTASIMLTYSQSVNKLTHLHISLHIRLIALCYYWWSEITNDTYQNWLWS